MTYESISHSSKAVKLLKPRISLEVEEFWAIALTSYKTVLEARMLFRGTVDSCLVHPRDVFRLAMQNNATAVIVAHSHPQGDAQPSDLDRLVTRRLVQAGQIMEIPIVDHLILSADDYFSFFDVGLISINRRGSSFYGASEGTPNHTSDRTPNRTPNQRDVEEVSRLG